MASLIEDIQTRAGGLAEGTPVSSGTFLDLGTKPAIRNALLRLLRSQKLLRVGRGIYVVPVVSRFGSSAPSAHRFIEEFSKQSGEDIVSSGATTANALGLTTQMPVQMVYWTSGRSRKLNLGKLVLHLEHVASWQLVHAKGALRRDRPCPRMGRSGASAYGVEGDRGQGSPSRRDKGRSAGFAVSTLVGGRLDSECRRCPAVVAKAEGNLNSVRCYSRITSYALIADEVIQGCQNRLRPQVAAAM